eukprot:TRINITY_DN9153_c0_g1_i1.p1 TRINITY_DN9153_c0_g1~~TRINITY_DN9153_c0_g1_i1.p1  ORF type:complete len:541 (+),score=136.03 TRINITY_DN9153_c0_g1_i1:133-1755(+)
MTKYIDLKHQFIRGLIARQKTLSKASHFKDKVLWYGRAIQSLSLLPESELIKSPEQALKLEGIGQTCADELSVIAKSKISTTPPIAGTAISAVQALLIALLQVEQAALEGQQGNWLVEDGGSALLVPVRELVARASTCCEEGFLPVAQPLVTEMPKRKKAKRSDEPTSSQETPASEQTCLAFKRMDGLVKLGYVKQRQRRGMPVFQLTNLGRKGVRRRTADGTLRIVSMGADQIYQHVFGHASSVSTTVVAVAPLPTEAKLATKSLYTNDKGQDGVVVLVDAREGGNNTHLQAAICQHLAALDVTFRTETLPFADYLFVHRYRGQERLLPLAVERKRVDDLAASVADGRLQRQAAFLAQFCRLASGRAIVLVEGQYHRYRVKTCCGHGCIGKHGQGNEDELKASLAALPAELEVQACTTAMAAAQTLVQYTQEFKTAFNACRLKAYPEDISPSLLKQQLQANGPCFTTTLTPDSQTNAMPNDDAIIVLSDDDDDEYTGKYSSNRVAKWSTTPSTAPETRLIDVPADATKATSFFAALGHL